MAAPNALSPGAQQVVKPGMTPCEQAHALNHQGMSHDAVKAMANGLPEHSSIKWATMSADKVSNPANKSDFEAVQAAKSYVQNPTPQARQAAAAAAAKTNFQTPGAWAAQSAGWAGSGTGLSAHAAAGAVMLAAAQGGKQIPAVSAQAPHLPTTQVPKVPTAQLPTEAVKGPDGLTMTAAQRAEMSKNCHPFLKLGCDVGAGKA